MGAPSLRPHTLRRPRPAHWRGGLVIPTPSKSCSARQLCRDSGRAPRRELGPPQGPSARAGSAAWASDRRTFGPGSINLGGRRSQACRRRRSQACGWGVWRLGRERRQRHTSTRKPSTLVTHHPRVPTAPSYVFAPTPVPTRLIHTLGFSCFVQSPCNAVWHCTTLKAWG